MLLPLFILFGGKKCTFTSKMPIPPAYQTVGVVGAGSFGTAIGNLLAHNVDVLLFSRNEIAVERINADHRNFEVDLSPRIAATSNMQTLADRCTLIFLLVPAANFRRMMHRLAPYLRPDHILIHGTKGFDTPNIERLESEPARIMPADVVTMSQVIVQESVVRRVGCLSGPNLAKEIIGGQPTATVIGSHFDEVIELGKLVLSSKRFHVFGNHDMLGAELAGALKNIIAIGSGILWGRGLGKNIQAMIITRGLVEMIHFGKAYGATSNAFFGTAGIGDLVATATSRDSRNFTFGYRLGRGESKTEIVATMPELAEGVRTLNITYHLAKYYKLRLPITEMLYRIVFENFDIESAIESLMTFPYNVDVDFL